MLCMCMCVCACIARATNRAVKVQPSITQLGLGGSAVKLFNMLAGTVKCATSRGTARRMDGRTDGQLDRRDWLRDEQTAK